MLWPTYSTLHNQLLIFEDLLVSVAHSVWNNYPTNWAQELICDPQKGVTTVFKYYCTAIDCRDTKPCPMFMSPSYPCQQTCQHDVAAQECWITCALKTSTIKCQLISLINNPLTPQLTLFWYLGWQSVNSQLNLDQCIWIGQHLANYRPTDHKVLTECRLS